MEFLMSWQKHEKQTFVTSRFLLFKSGDQSTLKAFFWMSLTLTAFTFILLYIKFLFFLLSAPPIILDP